MQKTFPHESGLPILADLDLPAGAITIGPADGPTIEVSLEPLGRDRQRAAEAIERATVDFDGHKLIVHVPGRFLREAQLLLKLALPPSSELEVRTASADVRIAIDMARLDVRTASGDIVGRNVFGDAVATTASGDIQIDHVAGRLDARSASGDLSAAGVGGELSLATASGDVAVGDLAQSAKIRTASGDVVIRSATSGEINVTTASGDVHVGVAPGRGAWIDLTTTTGDTSCSLAAEPEDESAADLRLQCRTVSGDIRVHTAAVA